MLLRSLLVLSSSILAANCALYPLLDLLPLIGLSSTVVIGLFYLHYRFILLPAIAYHEAGHALIAWMLPRAETVTFASTGQFLGDGGQVWWMRRCSDRLAGEIDRLTEVAIALAGDAAEDVSGQGHHWLISSRNDWKDSIKAMESVIRWRYRRANRAPPPPDRRLRGLRISAPAMGAICECRQWLWQTLTVNRSTLDRLASELIHRRTLKTPDLELILGPKK